MPRKLFYFVTALVFLAACKVGPKYKSPEVASPDLFRFDSVSTAADTVINLQWWELFGDPDLKTLIDTALKYNQDVMIAASRIEEARAVYGFNKADLWPSIGYDGTAGRSKANIPGLGLTDPFNNFQGMATLAWELDFWGKFRRANEAARAELLASEYGLRTIQISLISDIATLYFILLDYDARLNISRQTLQTRKESTRIIQERYNEGIVAEIDLNQAQIQEAIAASAVPLYERLVAQTENALSILLGSNPKAIVRNSTLQDQVVPPEIPSGIPAAVIARRPDINQAEQFVVAQNARIGVAVAMRFPSISLTGMFGAASNDLSNLLSNESMIWSVSGGILGPIFQFGKNKRRVDIERQRFKQDSLLYTQIILQAFREVEDALVEIQTLERESQARLQQMEAASNAASLSHERYDGGVTSYLEVLDSERSNFDARLAAAQTYQEYLNAYVYLYKVLGGGWISEEEKAAAENENNP